MAKNKIITDVLKAGKGYFFPVLFFVLIVVAGTGVYSYLNRSNDDYVFSIDGKKYSTTQVKQLIGYPVFKKVPRDKAAKQAYQLLKEVQTAKTLGYTPSQVEINTQKNSVYNQLNFTTAQQKKYNNWFTLIATDNVINMAVNATAPPGGYAGYSYVFYFGQHIEYISDYSVDGLGDTKLIDQDKAYAKEHAQYYHDQLKNNKIQPDVALSKSLVDMRSRGTGVNNPNFSVNFNSESGRNWSNAVYLSDIINNVSNLQKKGLSDVKTGKQVIKTSASSEKKKTETYYYFVNLNTVGNAKTIDAQQFNKTLKTLSAQYKGFKS